MDPILACDLYRYAGKADVPTLIRHLIHQPGFKFTFAFRMASKYEGNAFMFPLSRFLHRRYYYKYGIQIPWRTKIGKGLFIAHFGNIVIHPEAILGDNCNLAHGVTIGVASRGKRKGCPTIGSRVWFGTGSVVVGKVTVGDNVLIAPNAFVNFDVPSDAIVLGNPAKVIPRKDATAGYIESIMDSG
jgi:serine O-acetyltransferase